MTKQEKALQDSVIATYQHNMKLLSHIDTGLLKRIDILSDAINSGLYKERYELEFVKANGDFDIFDTATSQYLYSKKPRQWNNKATNDINFDSANSINLLKLSNYSKNNIDITEMKENIFDINTYKTMSDLSNFSAILQTYANAKTKKFKQFSKFIFIGTLLGRHIHKMGSKFQAKNYFIIEPNLEIFRLSMFVCDYSVLIQNNETLHFSIMDDEIDLYAKLNSFFNANILDNSVYKFYSTDYGVASILDKIANAIISRDPHLFDYNSVIDNITKSLTYGFSNFKVLNLGSTDTQTKALTNVPVLFIGAGPSLSKNISWIKENQNKFLIVAMCATLKTLEKNEIKPDIITSLDPQFGPINNQLSVNDFQTIENPVKIFSINTDKKNFDKFQDKSKIYIFETLAPILKNNIIPNGISVGEVTFQILLHLNFKNIYMVGIDLALDQKTGSTHDDSLNRQNSKHDISSKGLAENDITNKHTYGLREDTIKVKGNFLEEVTTTRLFAVSLNEYNHSASKYKKSCQNIYNISQNGAKIENTIAIKNTDIAMQNFEILGKQNIHFTIEYFLNDISFSSFDEYSRNNLLSELHAIEKLKNEIVETKNITFKNYDEFRLFTHKTFYKIVDAIGPNRFLVEILINYYFITNRYLDFCFNDQSIKNEQKLISEVSFVWLGMTYEIASKYQTQLIELLNIKK